MQRKISCKNSTLLSLAKTYKNLKSSFDEIEKYLTNAPNNLDWIIPAKNDIENKLLEISKKIKALRALSQDISTYLDNTVNSFNNVDLAAANSLDQQNNILLNSATGVVIVSGATLGQNNDNGNNKPSNSTERTSLLGLTDIKEKTPKGKKYKNYTDLGKEKDTKEEKSFKVGAGYQKTNSVYSKKTTYADISAGNLTYGANADVDLANGKVSATISGEVSALRVTKRGEVGDDFAALSGSYDAKVLSAKANAGVIFDPKSGDVNVKATAGAYLCEGTVKGGVNIVGVEGNVSATGYVGAGAELNLGLSNGKLKIDAGAAVGVGGKVSFEVGIPDVGKFTQKVGNVAESTKGNFIAATKTFSNVSNYSVSGARKATNNLFGMFS